MENEDQTGNKGHGGDKGGREKAQRVTTGCLAVLAIVEHMLGDLQLTLWQVCLLSM